MRVLKPVAFAADSKTLVMGLTRPQMQAFIERYPESRARIAILPPTITERAASRICAPPNCAGRWRPGCGWTRRRRPGCGSACSRMSKASTASSRRLPGSRRHLLIGGVTQGDRKLAATVRRADELGVSSRSAGSAISRAKTCRRISRRLMSLLILPGSTLPEPSSWRRSSTGCRSWRPTAVASRRMSSAAAPAPCLALRSIAKDSSPPWPGLRAAKRRLLGKRHCLWRIPELYSGLSVACDLIEAATWPGEIMMAADPALAQLIAAGRTGVVRGRADGCPAGAQRPVVPG